MTKRSKIVVGVVAFALIVPIAILVFVATFDWNRAKPLLQAHAGAALGRSVEIAGDLTAAWHWHRREEGSQVWSPGFQFLAGNVRIGNQDWAKRPHFVELKALEIDLRLLPLLWRRLDIPSIRLIHPVLDFERRKDGSNTWTFAVLEPGNPSAWTLDLGDIEFDAGEVHIADEERDLEVRAQITPLQAPIAFGQHVEGDDPTTRREVIQRVGRAAALRLRNAAEQRAEKAKERGNAESPPPYLFEWKASGTMAGAAVKGNGRFGGVLALKQPKPFPLRADIDVGTTEIALTGTITDPTSPDAVDMRLWISGRNLAQLYTIAGIALPNTPPYATVGRLAGRFHPQQSLLRYEDFSARVGGSDLGGTLTYRSGEGKPTLSGTVDSTLLRFKDLGALVGAGSTEDKAARGDDTAQPADRVLPAEPFNVERWGAMDADVHFTGKRVVRDEQQPISDVDTRIRMEGGVLTLDPLRFGMAGGTVAASLHIDSNARPAQGKVAIEARKLQLKRLFEKTDGLSTSLGEVNGEVKLAGNGHSIAEIFGSADGSLKLLMTQGSVSETLMEEAGLNVANVLFSKLRGDQQIRIDCAAASFSAKDGVANADLFVFDTENALIDIHGTVNLGDERIDLTLHPQTKGLRVFSLRSPLHATGTFQHVEVGVDKKSLLLRGGGAIGLALVAAPLAALLPLIAPSGDEQKSCAPLSDLVNKGRAEKH
ncbi:MAG: AsmA family protein [Dokdonella sp.]